ncbi:MAG: sirohydrochlorin cobaltochelatase [Desulfocapsa sp.]|nr:MAG: sirohydrochlorin cobaltochelatase [Desulfocapsa sp.]
MRFRNCSCVVLAFFLFIMGQPFQAAAGAKSQDRVIVLAVFGTSVPEALSGVLNIRNAVAAKFPKTRVELAFTSSIIREIWHNRKGDSAFFAAHKDIPAAMTDIQGSLATISRLQDEGYGTILVQPGHISMGEEYLDLLATVKGLNSISTIKEKNRLFDSLVAGRPALGTMGDKRPYPEDIKQVAAALKPDLEQAEKLGAALVYMGHGNDYFPSGGAYLQFAEILSAMSEKTNVYIATVEGFPGLDHTIKELQRDGVKKVLLKPFMTVAGDHARNDMAGEEKDSWKNILTAAGFEVHVDLVGLGENDAFAAVFAGHLAETAADNGIILE